MPAIEFRVTIKERAITEYPQTRPDMMRRDAQMCEYFIRHGAAVQVVCMLWKISAEEVRACALSCRCPRSAAGSHMPAPAARPDPRPLAELEAGDPRDAARQACIACISPFPTVASTFCCSRTIDEFFCRAVMARPILETS